ncbi:MAG: nitroreductase family protein [Clostridia bacterium]|nr:nitroreductase family protein [Clostridia bacterium]
MDLTQLAKERYSVRKFAGKPVEEEKLLAALEAGNLAPTAKNQQPQRIYVIKSAENLQIIRDLTQCHYGAPVILLFAYDAAEQWQNPLEPGVCSGQQDVSIAATHIMLKASELGLGTVWVNMFPPTETKRLLGLPQNEIPVLLMPIGYPAPDAAPSPRHAQRKPLCDTVKFI